MDVLCSQECLVPNNKVQERQKITLLFGSVSRHFYSFFVTKFKSKIIFVFILKITKYDKKKSEEFQMQFSNAMIVGSAYTVTQIDILTRFSGVFSYSFCSYHQNLQTVIVFSVSSISLNRVMAREIFLSFGMFLLAIFSCESDEIILAP